MKKLLLISLVIFFSLPLFAQKEVGIKFIKGHTIEQIFEGAKTGSKTPKYIFVDCYAVW